MDIVFIVYSHSSYSDVLQVQNDYLSKQKGHKILFIDRDPSEYITNCCFDRVLLYDDKLNYTKRLFQCLKIMHDDKTLPVLAVFLHDNDVLIRMDPLKIQNLMHIMETYSIDRIDLKWTNTRDEMSIRVDHEYTLIRNRDPYNYVYNVNPSIWRMSKLGEISATFDYNYRDVERFVQLFSAKYHRVYFLNGIHKLECGYYQSNHLFVFLHLTHGGKLLPKIDNGLDTDILDEYQKIIEKYEFRRRFRIERWASPPESPR